MSTKKPKLRKAPVRNVNLDKLNNFAAGAESRDKAEKKATRKPASRPAKPKPDYPWDEAGVREDVKKAINLLLPEPTMLKLRYIAKNTGVSQQKFIRKLIEPEIDKKIKEITK